MAIDGVNGIPDDEGIDYSDIEAKSDFTGSPSAQRLLTRRFFDAGTRCNTMKVSTTFLS